MTQYGVTSRGIIPGLTGYLTGIVDTEGGLYLTEHDLAKIGFLYLNEEKWDSHQLITAEWVRTSIAEHANPNLRYDPERRYDYGTS